MATQEKFIYVHLKLPGFTVFQGNLAGKPEYYHAKLELAAGDYELEEIKNPLGHEIPWYVIKGSKIGACKNYWPTVIIQDTPLNIKLTPPPTLIVTA